MNVTIVVFKLGVVLHGLIAWFPTIVLGQHTCQRRLATTYISRNCYMHCFRFSRLWGLLLQLEGVFDTGQFRTEVLVHLQALFNGRTAVNDRRMVASANQLSDT